VRRGALWLDLWYPFRKRHFLVSLRFQQPLTNPAK